VSAPDFNHFLHALRGEGLRRMPPGAQTFLSAGCAGGWYFDWIAENYPGIRRHVGIEMYSPKPEGLPANAEWIANSVADMRGVASDSVDLLFSGQNVEHLTQPDITGFLAESRRVLRNDGWLVLDSPNRTITERIGWFQPEHVIEFRVDEIKELVQLAGFDIESIRGLWQCYDPVVHQVLGLDPDPDDAINRRRVAAAETDPENAFVWWLTARRSDRPCDTAAIDRRVAQIAGEVFPRLGTRFKTQVGTLSYGPLMAEARGAKGVQGFIVYGPYTPLFPGRYHAVFRVRALEKPGMFAGLAGSKLGRADIGSFARSHEIAGRDFNASDLSAPGRDGYCALPLDFTLEQAAFGVEFRVFTTGRVPLGVALPVQLTRSD
jgi:hypothetical protein